MRQSVHIDRSKKKVEFVENSKKQKQIKLFNILGLQYKVNLIDISTQDVLNRIKLALIPFNKTYLATVKDKIDFYAPFWILNTLLMILNLTSNLYLNELIDKNNQTVFRNLKISALLLYGSLLFSSLIIYGTFNFLLSKIDLKKTFCIYGYSLVNYIPATLFCMIPVTSLQWMFLIIFMINSSIFIAKHYLRELKRKLTFYQKFVLLFFIMNQIGFMCAIKILFFK